MGRLQADITGERIDLFLAKRLNLSRSYVVCLIKDGLIKIDGKSIKPHHKTKIGEEIEVNLPDKEIKPENIPLDIVYEDSEIIIVNKPAGQITHPTARIRKGTLVNALLFHTSLPDTGNPERPGIVHRLDKDTSGLLVVAKTKRAYESLIKMIKERAIKRKYLALVLGRVKEDYGEVCKPIGRPKRGGVLMKPYGRKMKEAKTSYRVLQRGKNASLLEVSLHTGRTHQIRVHLASIGYPVIGDKSYGKKTNLINRQALHAFSLSFLHPITNEPLHFEVEPPSDIKEAMAFLLQHPFKLVFGCIS
ncbi:MAG: RluA family pseudouridine synthase [bacterium]